MYAAEYRLLGAVRYAAHGQHGLLWCVERDVCLCLHQCQYIPRGEVVAVEMADEDGVDTVEGSLPGKQRPAHLFRNQQILAIALRIERIEQDSGVAVTHHHALVGQIEGFLRGGRAHNECSQKHGGTKFHNILYWEKPIG